MKNLALKLTDSYLSHRTQFSQINGTLCTGEYITRGLLQGTYVSPLSINDTPSLTLNGELVCCACDTKQATLGRQLFRKVRTDIHCIRLWLLKNNLILGTEKPFTLPHYLINKDFPNIDQVVLHTDRTSLNSLSFCNNIY